MADRLYIWIDSSASTVSSIPLGTVPAGTSEDFPFRVLNSSVSYTATDVTVELVGADATTFYLSDGSDTLTASIALGDLPPAVRSAPLYFRRVTPHAASGPADVAIRLSSAGWTA